MTDRPRTIQVRLAEKEMEEWTTALAAAVAASGRKLEILAPDAPPAEVDYLVYNIDSGLTDFAPFTRLRAILNTWAGVEGVVGRVTWPAHIPFCRMVEPGLTEGMVEYLAGHAMRHHLDIDRAIADSAAGRWQKWAPPLARDRGIGILGLGALGAATAETLRHLGFPVSGWSRGPKDLPGIACHHGPDGLEAVLRTSEILLVILPLTPATENLLDARTLARLPRGGAIVNAGRGPLIDDDALLAALASGHLRHATLDVFRQEPLPGDHPFWRNPKVTVTPHIAAITRAKTATEAILEQICRDLDGETLLHIVDPARGY